MEIKLGVKAFSCWNLSQQTSRTIFEPYPFTSHLFTSHLPSSFLRFSSALPPIAVQLMFTCSALVVQSYTGQQLDNNWTTTRLTPLLILE